MIHLEDRAKLNERIAAAVSGEKQLLQELLEDVRPLKSRVHQIQPRATTAISFVATDGGNARLHFDPFLVQLVRVVDSSDNEYWMDTVTASADLRALSKQQFDNAGAAHNPLGRMMKQLGVRTLSELSHMIRTDNRGRPVSPSWVQVYRELVEWAVLLSIVQTKNFGTDTLLVVDGLLRTKVFSGDLFERYLELLHQTIEHHRTRERRKIFIVGVAKKSKVLARYRLPLAMERVMATNYPAFVEIPRELEAKAYTWAEFARGADVSAAGGEGVKFVGGKMYFVKFGSRARDPIWPVDVLLAQESEVETILGHLLSDAQNGFPIPFYPRCLQKAHENAALVDFDLDVLQDGVFEALRSLVEDASVLDTFRFLDNDPAQERYGSR